MNLMDTMKGSMLDGFYPAGWDMERMAACHDDQPDSIYARREFWHPEFSPVCCADMNAFNVKFGHEIACAIKEARDAGRKLAMICPVGPMDMYRWTVYFLKEWGVSCSHLSCFNMDEWSDAEGNALPDTVPGSFTKAMKEVFYAPLGSLAPPENQRFFATKQQLPQYADAIASIKAGGGSLVTAYGIGRAFHIAFWEPHFAADFQSDADWKKATFRLGAKLHPITVEQNATWWFKSMTPAVPATANTIGPGLFLQSDKMIGGCFGISSALLVWAVLRYGPDMWLPASYVPTKAGKLFFTQDMLAPLVTDDFTGSV